MSVPMVLSVLREWDAGGLKHKHVREIMLTLESFHFIFNAVTSQRATGGWAGMFASHAKQLHVAKPKDKLSVCRELRDKLRDRLPPLVGQLGNLLLVSEEVNQKLGNKTFPVKKKMLKDANIRLDEFISARSRWDNKAIEDHTDWLAILAYNKIWKL